MTEPDHNDIQKLLKEAFPPMDPEPARDLWPAMLRKMDVATPAAKSGFTFALPWYDWALLGGSAGVLAFFPNLILLFAYHF